MNSLLAHIFIKLADGVDWLLVCPLVRVSAYFDRKVPVEQDPFLFTYLHQNVMNTMRAQAMANLTYMILENNKATLNRQAAVEAQQQAEAEFEEAVRNKTIN